MTRTELLEGRILSVGIRGPRLDLTVISDYAPMDAPNGEARDREEFWEVLNNCLVHLPRRSAPILGGDFNARLVLWPTAGHVGNSGIQRRNQRPQDLVDSENGAQLRELLERHGLCAPLTFLRPPCCN